MMYTQDDVQQFREQLEAALLTLLDERAGERNFLPVATFATFLNDYLKQYPSAFLICMPDSGDVIFFLIHLGNDHYGNYHVVSLAINQGAHRRQRPNYLQITRDIVCA